MKKIIDLDLMKENLSFDEKVERMETLINNTEVFSREIEDMAFNFTSGSQAWINFMFISKYLKDISEDMQEDLDRKIKEN